jgi:hypothetical protein
LSACLLKASWLVGYHVYLLITNCSLDLGNCVYFGTQRITSRESCLYKQVNVAATTAIVGPRSKKPYLCIRTKVVCYCGFDSAALSIA